MGMVKFGDQVRIGADEYPDLVGLTGEVLDVSLDGSAAWVETEPPFGVWCSVSNLEVIQAHEACE